jgi:L-threonine-O-3-phosphate decarboxylase
LGLDPEEVLDFSVNSNPYGPSPTVWQSLARVPLARYPDREALALRRALADHLGVPPAQIVVGNGTAELLWLVSLAFLRPGDQVLVIGPTFGEYARVAALLGAQVERWTAQPGQGFAVEPEEVAQSLRRVQPRLAFLGNPNNPTGTVIPTEAIAAWAQAQPQTLFVVDEAYLAFAPDLRSALTTRADNVLVLRSMTKDYALAGLRLGYAAGREGVIAALARVRPPWNVNALAQAAGVAALADTEHLQQSLGELARTKEALVAGLTELGLAPLPSAVHFFLVHVGDGAASRRALLHRKVLVRDCASFGLPAYVRIATRRPEENARLLAAIHEVAPWWG